MRPNRARIVDTKDVAEKTYRTFYKRGSSYEVEVANQWPSRLQEVGAGKAELYRSNKWQKNLKEYEDYKHVVEGSRTLYVVPGWLVHYGQPSKKLDVCGPYVTLEGPLPRHITRLGPLLGLQVHLFQEGAAGEPRLEPDQGYYEIAVAHASLAAAKHPKTGDTFLAIYDRHGIHAVLVGGELGITADGIVG